MTRFSGLRRDKQPPGRAASPRDQNRRSPRTSPPVLRPYRHIPTNANLGSTLDRRVVDDRVRAANRRRIGAETEDKKMGFRSLTPKRPWAAKWPMAEGGTLRSTDEYRRSTCDPSSREAEQEFATVGVATIGVTGRAVLRDIKRRPRRRHDGKSSGYQTPRDKGMRYISCRPDTQIKKTTDISAD